MKTHIGYLFLWFSAVLALCVPACVAPGMSCEIDPNTGDCVATPASSTGGGTSASGGASSGASGASSGTDGGNDCHATVADPCVIEGWLCGDNRCLCGIWIPETFLQTHHVSCPPVTAHAGDSGSAPAAPTTACSPTILLATCAVTSTCNGTRGCTPQGTWGPCTPPSEVCNGKDDDCDGVVDNGNICGSTPSVCTPGETGPCATGCTVPLGTATCGVDSQWVSCIPPTEVCGNNIDDNCNGQTDEACTTTTPPDGTNPPPSGSGLRKITYRFTVPSPFPAASTLTVYDTAVDAQGNAVTRAVPLGTTYGDINYAWGSAFDDSNDVCYVKDSGIIECVVHRPAGTTLKVNTEAVFGTGTFWSCNGTNGETFGLQEVFVDDVPQKLTWEVNNAGPYEDCRFIVKI